MAWTLTTQKDPVPKNHHLNSLKQCSQQKSYHLSNPINITTEKRFVLVGLKIVKTLKFRFTLVQIISVVERSIL